MGKGNFNIIWIIGRTEMRFFLGSYMKSSCINSGPRIYATFSILFGKFSKNQDLGSANMPPVVVLAIVVYLPPLKNSVPF